MTAKIGQYGVVRKSGLIAAVGLTAGLSGVAFAPAASAATSCASTTTVTISATTSVAGLTLGLTMSPTVLSVHVGDCVAFDNTTKDTVTVSATGSSYNVQLPQGTTTPPGADFAPKSAGAAVVDATPSNLPAATAITILPATVPTVTPSPNPSKSPAHPSSGGSPKPKSSGHSSTAGASPNPTKTSSTKHSKRLPHGLTGVSLPPLPPLPSNQETAVPLGTNPLVAPGLTAAPAPTTTASQAAMVVAGPIEPLSGNGRGLPEAIAILLVLGLITGWGRVLLASHEAVDDLPRTGHRL
jgi:plastocyanin